MIARREPIGTRNALHPEPNQRGKLMRFTAKLLTASMFAVLAACGGNNANNVATENVTETNAMTETTTINETNLGADMNATGNVETNTVTNTYTNTTTNNAM
jgi:Flp pilus assembly protein TadD